jgi:hypothetical protein
LATGVKDGTKDELYVSLSVDTAFPSPKYASKRIVRMAYDLAGQTGVNS